MTAAEAATSGRTLAIKVDKIVDCPRAARLFMGDLVVSGADGGGQVIVASSSFSGERASIKRQMALPPPLLLPAAERIALIQTIGQRRILNIYMHFCCFNIRGFLSVSLPLALARSLSPALSRRLRALSLGAKPSRGNQINALARPVLTD